MLFKLLICAAAFQLGPFYEQKKDGEVAFRPLWSQVGEKRDFLWPVVTAHRDWWRLLFFTHYQENDKGDQFEIMPIWWRGHENEYSYTGLFPIQGYHPHFALVYDLEFVFWPIWMRYRTPRPENREWMTTNAYLWPFLHFRDDGSWGFWPLYVNNHQRESFHQTVLWPIITWAKYEPDRDTAGAGSSWMFWPLAGGVTREREDQWLFLPPLFSYAKLANGSRRYRMPWPIFEYETSIRRNRLSIFPLYEHVRLMTYSGEVSSSVTRFGWKLVEIYDDEVRVFPIWVSRSDDSYFRFWPFWESRRGEDGVTYGRFLSLFPIRNVDAVDRNWAKFWTFYESAQYEDHTDHSLFWGIIRWRTEK